MSEQMRIKATVGDVIHYQPFTGATPKVATVSEINPDDPTVVNLSIGPFFSISNVRYSDDPAEGHWHWPRPTKNFETNNH